MVVQKGVNAVLDNSEIEEILNIEDMDDCLNVLNERVLSGGYPDDYSVIIVESVK